MEILSLMGRRLRLLLSEKERAKYERFKNRTGFSLGGPFVFYKNNTSFSKSSKASNLNDTISLYAKDYSKKDEGAIKLAFEVLINGMRKGNQTDKIAVEALMETIKHKQVSNSFICSCTMTYNDALNDYKNIVKKLQDIAQISDDNSKVTLPSATITHRIFLPNLPK